MRTAPRICSILVVLLLSGVVASDEKKPPKKAKLAEKDALQAAKVDKKSQKKTTASRYRLIFENRTGQRVRVRSVGINNSWVRDFEVGQPLSTSTAGGERVMSCWSLGTGKLMFFNQLTLDKNGVVLIGPKEFGFAVIADGGREDIEDIKRAKRAAKPPK